MTASSSRTGLTGQTRLTERNSMRWVIWIAIGLAAWPILTFAGICLAILALWCESRWRRRKGAEVTKC